MRLGDPISPEMRKWLDETVAALPPPTPEQVAIVRAALRGDRPNAAAEPSATADAA